MNRVEFMTRLASLLQDIPAEERMDAMQYYNDYFDDAGEENEERVIIELGSPEKVASILKEGINGEDKEAGEFTDTGYHNSKFEKQEMPEPRMTYSKKNTSHTVNNDDTDVKERWTSKPIKILLIIAIIICAIPVILPLIVGLVAAAAGIILAVVASLIAIVVASIVVAIAGLAVVVTGIIGVFGELAAGLALTGIGLILISLGAIASVASIKLCTVVFPGIIRGIVWLCRKPFERKAVA